MSRKKNDDIIGNIFALVAVLLFLYWITDRTKFWVLLVVFFVLLALGAVIVAKMHNKKFKTFNEGNDLLARLRQMTPTQFEIYIADLYNKLGYETEQVGGAYDGGIDVVATRKGVMHYIQCKKFITRQVGVGDLRNFYGAMAAKLTNAKGIFITTNVFTTEAEKFAEDKPIELVDGNKLLEIIGLTRQLTSTSIDQVPADVNICPWCGSQLVKRKSKFGEFVGCSAFPKCRYKKT